jgi:hypothetical protein
VILDLDVRRVMGLNPVGSFVWGLLDGKRTVADLAAAVSECFQVPAERALADVGAFLSILRARQLIEVSS